MARSKTSVVDVFAQLARPIVDAWHAEGGPGWWVRTKARVARWLRRQADRLDPPVPEARVSVTVPVHVLEEAAQVLTPPPVPVQEPACEPVPDVLPLPAPKPKRVRKPAAPKAKPVPAAARTTKPRAKPKAKPTPAPTPKAPAKPRTRKAKPVT